MCLLQVSSIPGMTPFFTQSHKLSKQGNLSFDFLPTKHPAVQLSHIYSHLQHFGTEWLQAGREVGGVPGAPLQFIPLAPTACPQWTCAVYRPGAAAYTHHSLTRAVFSCSLFSAHGLFDLHTVHWTGTLLRIHLHSCIFITVLLYLSC